MEGKLCDESSTSDKSRISPDQETRITIRSGENSDDFTEEKNGDIDGKPSGLLMKDEGLSDGTEVQEEKCSCKIEVKSGNFEGESQRVCRICHLNKLENGKNLVELIELGCGCKGELGFAHTVCAESWFKLRGNRSCEICGLTATNITGVADNRFMEEWNESVLVSSIGTSFSERRRGCWHGQPLCNFLMACLVIAFVLPWFFRGNMF